MPEVDPRLNEKFPLELLQIVFTAFLIAGTLYTLSILGTIGYNIIALFFVSVPIYIPVVYIAWIYKIGYTYPSLLSNSKMHKALYATSVLALLIALAQLQEFNPLYEEVLSHKGFLDAYFSKCLFHPFFTALLILLLLYIRHDILKERMYTFFWANIITAGALLLLISHRAYELILTLLNVSGIWLNGLNYVLIALLFLLFILCLAERFGNVFSRTLKKQPKDKETKIE